MEIIFRKHNYSNNLEKLHKILSNPIDFFFFIHDKNFAVFVCIKFKLIKSNWAFYLYSTQSEYLYNTQIKYLYI